MLVDNTKTKSLHRLKQIIQPHVGHSIKYRLSDSRIVAEGVIQRLTIDFNHGTIWVWLSMVSVPAMKRIYPSQILGCSCQNLKRQDQA